nr:NBS-LRR type disease resistance protein [Ipomoea batatas]
MTEIVKKLRDEGRNISELTLNVSMVYQLNVDQLSGTTSKFNLEEIYRWVEDENVTSIGVYGTRGVGKTTLVKHIYNQILENNPHANVYWVTVSQDFNIRKLQDNIAKIAGIRISDDENEEQRAAILRNYLVGNNVVLILDNVWDNIHLDKLGAPPRDKGYKLILTTRLLDVCRKIGCQKLFKVNVLNEEEAWNLFKEILVQDDHTVLTNAIENLAKELAKKCGGLPLELNTVAASMRGVNDDHIWRNTIKNFQNVKNSIAKFNVKLKGINPENTSSVRGSSLGAGKAWSHNGAGFLNVEHFEQSLQSSATDCDDVDEVLAIQF